MAKKEVFVFKTNIQKLSQVRIMEGQLNERFGIGNWNFDLEDIDKIFRIEIIPTSVAEINILFKEFGYCCEELL